MDFNLCFSNFLIKRLFSGEFFFKLNFIQISSLFPASSKCSKNDQSEIDGDPWEAHKPMNKRTDYLLSTLVDWEPHGDFIVGGKKIETFMEGKLPN